MIFFLEKYTNNSGLRWESHFRIQLNNLSRLPEHDARDVKDSCLLRSNVEVILLSDILLGH